MLSYYYNLNVVDI